MKKIHLTPLFLSMFLIIVQNRVAYSGNSPDFLGDALGARVVGIGSACVSVLDDINALLCNPAGLSRLKGFNFLTHSRKGQDSVFGIDSEYIAGSYNLKNITLGLSYFRSELPNITHTTGFDPVTDLPIITGNFSYKEQAILAGLGFKLYKHLYVGATYKDLSQTIYDYKPTGNGWDAGLLYSSFDTSEAKRGQFQIGLNIQNIGGSKIGKDEIPQNVKIGTSWMPFRNFLISYEYNKSQDKIVGKNGKKHLFGGEWWIYKDIVSIRGGSNDGKLTWGVGLNLKNFKIDIASKKDKNIGSNLLLSISANWQPKKRKENYRKQTSSITKPRGRITVEKATESEKKSVISSKKSEVEKKSPPTGKAKESEPKDILEAKVVKFYGTGGRFISLVLMKNYDIKKGMLFEVFDKEDNMVGKIKICDKKVKFKGKTTEVCPIKVSEEIKFGAEILEGKEEIKKIEEFETIKIKLIK